MVIEDHPLKVPSLENATNTIHQFCLSSSINIAFYRVIGQLHRTAAAYLTGQVSCLSTRDLLYMFTGLHFPHPKH